MRRVSRFCCNKPLFQVQTGAMAAMVVMW